MIHVTMDFIRQRARMVRRRSREAAGLLDALADHVDKLEARVAELEAQGCADGDCNLRVKP